MARTLADCVNERDEQVVTDVANFGWHVVNIMEENGLPGWSFSIGLFANYDHPEIVVFGLGVELGHRVINGLGERIKAGNRMEADHQYGEILANVECTFKPVQKKWYKWILGYARWYYDGNKFPVLQCIWPDKQQHYPWESKFKAEWVWAQPLLFHKDRVAARASELIESLSASE